eukprot:5620168-Pleurochrysis_carterae.AAC.3
MPKVVFTDRRLKMLTGACVAAMDSAGGSAGNALAIFFAVAKVEARNVAYAKAVKVVFILAALQAAPVEVEIRKMVRSLHNLEAQPEYRNNLHNVQELLAAEG